MEGDERGMELRRRLETSLQFMASQTAWSKPFLQSFLEKGLVSIQEAQFIDSLEGDDAKALELYRLIANHPGSYPALIEALLITRQSDFAKMLEEDELQVDLADQGSQSGSGVTKRPFEDDLVGSSKRIRVDTLINLPTSVTTDSNVHFSGSMCRQTVLDKLTPQNNMGWSTVIEGCATMQTEKGGPGSSGGDEAHHCLFNEDVLDQVFKHIIHRQEWNEVTRNFQNIRQVCKTWRNSVTRLYRRTRPAIRFEALDPEEDKGAGLSEMVDFMAVMRSSEMIPLLCEVKYRISCDVYACGGDMKILHDFLKFCGSVIVSLSLQLCVSNQYSSKKIQLKIPDDLNLMELRVLSATVLECEPGRISRGTAAFMRLIGNLQKSASGKKLKKVQCDFTLDGILGRPNEVLAEEFQKNICDLVPGTVKILRLGYMLLPDQAFNRLTQNGMKLTELYITANSSLDGKSLSKFLETQADTLKTLEIENPYDHPVFLEFPPLNQLQELSVCEATIRPFSFSKTFPSLSKLDVLSWAKKDTFLDLLSCARKPATSVKGIYLPGSMPLAPHIRKIGQCFPSLIELIISPAQDFAKMLEGVFTHFENIEDLRINFNPSFRRRITIDLDSILSGYSVQDCENISNQDFEDVDLGQFPRKPCILDLKRLRGLELTINSKAVIKLTDFSAYFVFLKMDLLESLCIPLASKIRPMYLKLLGQKLDLEFNHEGILLAYIDEDTSEDSSEVDSDSEPELSGELDQGRECEANNGND